MQTPNENGIAEFIGGMLSTAPPFVVIGVIVIIVALFLVLAPAGGLYGVAGIELFKGYRSLWPKAEKKKNKRNGK